MPRLWGGEEQEARKAAASLGAGGERKGMGVMRLKFDGFFFPSPHLADCAKD